MIYTSGSTGMPKGVMNQHDGVVNRLQWMQDAYQLQSIDRVLQKTPYSFDVSVWEFLWPLQTGAALVVAKPDGHKDPVYLAEVIQQQDISVLHFVPSMLAAMLHGADWSACRSVKKVVCSGEALPFTLQKDFFATGTQAELHNLYGPTEAAIDVSYWVCDPVTELKVVPIGQPIANIQLHVLGEQGQMLPVGAPGELHISGIGVARGYLNRPELTAEKFITNPFASIEDKAKGYDRMYKTGDLVRWLPNGTLEYLGRNDFQVKIRGLRIELGEIEHALTSEPSVQQAVVIARTRRERGDQYLAAYLIATEGQTIEEEVLREALNSQLPDYMVPDTFTELDTIPLTINGKVDRKALPEPEFVVQEAYVTPRTDLEMQLCEIWQVVLGLKQVGVTDNFFRIGGDSIISIQLVSRLRREGFTLQTKAVFEAPTIRQLALKLADNKSEVAIDAEQGVLKGKFALLPIQKWFFELSLAEPHHFNQSFMLSLPGAITRHQIEQALEQLAAHHDILRAGYYSDEKCSDGEEWRQCYYADCSAAMAPLQQLDVSTLDEEALQTQLSDWQAGFDLAQGPLWQAAHLTSYADGSARLFFAAHHLIIDAVSWRILAEDIQQLLTGQELASKTSSYRQWVAGVQDYAASHTAEVGYWKTMMAGQAELPAPQEPQHYQVKLSQEQTVRLLQQAGGGYNTEVNDLLLSALGLALCETLGRDVNHITLEGHGREAINNTLDVSRTVGWFTTQYPVRLNAAGELADIVVQTKEMLRAVPNKGLGYGALVSTGVLEGRLPAISFNYLGQFGQEARQQTSLWQLTGELSGQDIALKNGLPDLLSINGAVHQGQLSFDVGASLPTELSERFVHEFEYALNIVVDHACRVSKQDTVTTPSDFSVDGLSIEHLANLKEQFEAEPSDSDELEVFEI
ncbi:hypothetical protein VCHA29O37_30001 [Vibrio chagasii]|nr:hypothetical protein VCHA29O37_30001 [Vibrio chagasii]